MYFFIGGEYFIKIVLSELPKEGVELQENGRGRRWQILGGFFQASTLLCYYKLPNH